MLNPLHSLIQALSPAEKKRIRLNINKFHPEQENKKLLLFDTLNKSKQYDAEIEKGAYRQAGYNSSYLAADHHLLYNLVLTELCDFHNDKSAALRIFRSLEKAYILFEKKLFAAALSQLQKTHKLATLHEAWSLVLEVMRLEQRILKIQGLVEEACQLIDNQTLIWNKQLRCNQLSQLHYRSMQLRIQLAKARKEEELAAFSELMSSELLQDKNQLQGFFEHFHFLECYCNYYFVKNEKNAELACNQALIDLLNEYPWIKEDQPLNYLIISTRILAINRNLQPTLFLDSLQAYRCLAQHFNKQQQEAERIIFIFSYNYELDYYILNKYWDKALAIIPEIEAGLKKHENMLDEAFKLTCFYRFACTYFFNRMYEPALDLLHRVLQNFEEALRPDVHRLSYIIQIIIHYELNNKKLMKHLIQTTKYHLEKNAGLFQSEDILLAQLKKLVGTSTKSKEISHLKKLKTALLALFEQNEAEKQVLESFDFLAWIAYKLAALD